MKQHQKGFSVVELLIIIVIVGLIGTVGWLVYDRQKSKAKTNESTKTEVVTDPAENKQTTSAPAGKTPLVTEDFTLVLPEGFKESSDGRIFTFVGTPKKTYSYIDDKGNYFEYNVRSEGGSGYSPDFSWTFTQTGDKITLDKTTTSVCTNTESGFCTSGNNRLDVYVGSKNKDKAYYFTFGNTKSETVGDLSFVDKFISGLRIK